MSLEEPISHVYAKDISTIGLESPAIDAAFLMVEKKVSCLLILEGVKAIGIITERDMLQKITAIGADPRRVRVKDIMTTALISTTMSTSIGDAAKKMIDNKVKRLIVVTDDGAFAGLVNMTDLIKWMATQEELSDSLINYLTYGVP